MAVDMPSAIAQLRFDIADAIVPRRRRRNGERPQPDAIERHGEQFEMQMAPAAPPPAIDRPRLALPKRPQPPPEPASPSELSFAAWLLDQTKRGGMIGELARAARIDPGFPKRGSVREVRARFNKLGADGDAFEALDDAERAYDRD